MLIGVVRYGCHVNPIVIGANGTVNTTHEIPIVSKLNHTLTYDEP